MSLQLKNSISSVELFELKMPLVHPFRTSFGIEEFQRPIIVKITDEEGFVGWGETPLSESPGYCYETTKTAWHIQTDFLVPIMKKNNDNQDIEKILKEFDVIRGHEFAKGGIEAALLALKAESEGNALGKLYEATKNKIPTGVSIGIQTSIDKLIERINYFLNQGYQRIKVKIERGWEIEPIKRIRQEFGDIKLMVDANSDFRLKEQDVKILQELDNYGLMMIEQPLAHNDMLEHKKLQAQLSTPICLDESIHSVTDAKLALEFECCKIINIKPGRVGGFLNALKIAKLGGADTVWCGGMLETGIGRLHNLILQANSNFTIPGDTSGSNRYYQPDIIEPEVIVDDNGYIEVPTKRGLGHLVNEGQILKYQFNSQKVNLN